MSDHEYWRAVHADIDRLRQQLSTLTISIERYADTLILDQPYDVDGMRLAQLREALDLCGKHLEDCCRTDLDWKAQMASHDAAVRALAALSRA